MVSVTCSGRCITSDQGTRVGASIRGRVSSLRRWGVPLVRSVGEDGRAGRWPLHHDAGFGLEEEVDAGPREPRWQALHRPRGCGGRGSAGSRTEAEEGALEHRLPLRVDEQRQEFCRAPPWTYRRRLGQSERLWQAGAEQKPSRPPSRWCAAASCSGSPGGRQVEDGPRRRRAPQPVDRREIESPHPLGRVHDSDAQPRTRRARTVVNARPSPVKRSKPVQNRAAA